MSSHVASLLVAGSLDALTYWSLAFMVAAGLTVVFGMLGFLNAAHTSFYMLGGYVAYTVAGATGSFWAALLLAPLLVAATGVVLERLLFAKLYAAGHASQLLLTIGLAYVIAEASKLVWGDSAFAVAPPASLAGRITVLGATLPVYHLFIIGAAVVLVCVIAALLLGTRLGMVIRAASVHPEMVGALGFKVRDIYTLVFAVGLYLAAFAGVVMAPLEGGPIRPWRTMPWSRHSSSSSLAAWAVCRAPSSSPAFWASCRASAASSFRPMPCSSRHRSGGVLLFRPVGVVRSQIRVTAYPDTLAETRSPRRARALNLHTTAEAFATVALLTVLVAAPALFSRATINDLGQGRLPRPVRHQLQHPVQVFRPSILRTCRLLWFRGLCQALLLQSFAGLPVPLLVLATGLSAAVLGCLIGQICVRRSGAYFSMTTLAIAALFYAIAFKWHAATGGTDGLDSFMPSDLMLLPRWHLDSPGIAQTYLLVLAILIPVAAAAWALLELTPFGNAVVAVKHNEKRAAFLGYDTHRVKLANFTLAAGLAGVAGALWAIDNSFVSTDSIDLSFSTTVIIIAFLGGSVWFWGPLIGAVVYIAASDWLSALTPTLADLAGPGLHSGRAVRARRHRRPGEVAVAPRLAPAGGRGCLRPPCFVWTGSRRDFQARRCWVDLDLSVPRWGKTGPDRPERCRQDHADQRDHGRSSVGCGGHPVSRQKHPATAAPSAQPPGYFTLVPDSQPVRRDDGRREYPQRGPCVIADCKPARGGCWGACTRSFAEAVEIAEMVGLGRALQERADNLSYGMQRRLDIALVLAQRPELIILDEPAAGLSAAETRDLIGVLQATIGKRTLILVEHDMDVVYALSDRITRARLRAGADRGHTRRNQCGPEMFGASTSARRPPDHASRRKPPGALWAKPDPARCIPAQRTIRNRLPARTAMAPENPPR